MVLQCLGSPTPKAWACNCKLDKYFPFDLLLTLFWPKSLCSSPPFLPHKRIRLVMFSGSSYSEMLLKACWAFSIN